ncbi:MAG: DHHA1 domain-containing protein, partial [Coriobacteriia bacterium]|nr:DHHA1 domain-containing protein [Coriobacteriia bacterium]
ASIDEAREAGVTALFGEKYGDVVRVVELDGFSSELCGGCHVSNTSQIGFVKIVSESSVGASTRRIEAVTGPAALAYVNGIENDLKAVAAELKAPVSEVVARCTATCKTLKELQAEAKKAKQAAASDGVTYLLDQVVTAAAGYPVVVAAFKEEGVGADDMRNAWDIIRTKLSAPGAAVLAAVNDGGKPILMAAGTDEAVAAGFHAGQLIKSISSNIKGGGGGKPTMAQAGGKDASGIEAALEQAKQLLS